MSHLTRPGLAFRPHSGVFPRHPAARAVAAAALAAAHAHGDRLAQGGGKFAVARDFRQAGEGAPPLVRQGADAPRRMARGRASARCAMLRAQPERRMLRRRGRGVAAVCRLVRPPWPAPRVTALCSSECPAAALVAGISGRTSPTSTRPPSCTPSRERSWPTAAGGTRSAGACALSFATSAPD